MSNRELERLRQVVARLMDAQHEALEAVDGALEFGGDGLEEEAWRNERLEQTLEDVRDILAGASEDAREMLEEGAG